jgi:hypothetical protein
VAIVVASRPARQPARNRLVPSVDRRADAVRCVFNTLTDLEDETLHYFAPARMTVAVQPKWLPYRIGAGGIEWEAPIDAPPESRGISEAQREKGALCREVMEWLREELRDGPVAQKKIALEAREYGYSIATLRRARAKLGVRSKRIGFDAYISYWAWVLETENREGTETITTPEPVSDVSTYGTDVSTYGKPKQAAKRKARGANGKKAAAPAERIDAEMDTNTLSQMMTPELVMQILRERRGCLDGEWEDRMDEQPRRGKNGKATSNGRHRWKGNGRKAK